MAAKKVAADENAVTIETFKQAIAELGIKLCEDVTNGKARNPEATLAEISNLYNAIK